MRRWVHVALVLGLCGCTRVTPQPTAPARAKPRPTEPDRTKATERFPARPRIVEAEPMPTDVACTFKDIGFVDLQMAGEVEPISFEGPTKIVVPIGEYNSLFAEVELEFGRVRGRTHRWHATPRDGFIRLADGIQASSDWWSAAAIQTIGDEGGVVFELRPSDAPPFTIPEPVSAKFSCEELTSRPPPRPPSRPRWPMYRLGLGGSDSVEVYSAASGNGLVATILAGRHFVYAGRRRGERVEARVLAGGIIFEGWLPVRAIPKWDAGDLRRAEERAKKEPPAPPAWTLLDHADEYGGLIATGSVQQEPGLGGEITRPFKKVVCPAAPTLYWRSRGALHAVGTANPEAAIEIDGPDETGVASIPGTHFRFRADDLDACHRAKSRTASPPG